MLHKDGNKLIRCFAAQGPIFGTGHDLFISDKCQASQSSFACFPFHYDWEKQEAFMDPG
jgi:hypothetical protein